MAIPTLGGINLTGSEMIDVTKSANIIPLPLPGLDSDDTEVADLLGVIKTISITGVFAESTIAATKILVDNLEALINGDQLVVDFISDQTGTVSVMIADIRTTWDLPGFKCRYDIKLIQGKLLGL